MEELYLEVFSNVSLTGTTVVPLETLIALFIIEYCQEPPMLLTLVQSTAMNNRAHFRVKLPKVLFQFRNEYDATMPANMCRLPLMISKHIAPTYITGLCSAMRNLLTMINENHPLLGFKFGSLSACSEISPWTQFCEVDMIKTVDDMFNKDMEDWFGETVELPKDIARLEIHMSKPVKAHNIQKEKQELARKEGYFLTGTRTPDARLDLIRDLEHTYIEGHKMTLADLILFPCVFLIFQFYGSTQVKEIVPFTYEWYETLLRDRKAAAAINIAYAPQNLPLGISYTLPYVQDVSLYKRERVKARKQLFMYQYVIDNVYEVLVNIEKMMDISEKPFGYDEIFDWSYVPFELQLAGRDFPKDRLERKAQQLDNLIKAVLKIAKRDDRIVDFGAGSGYLGLILAQCLPTCTIILVENKSESLKRAKEQAVSSRLTNVIFCQGNIEHFLGQFNIGISLHVCGVGTDIVIEKCLNAKASFICCPCCYGSIEPNHSIKYPRSTVFKDSLLTVSDYYTLAHASDQANEEFCDRTTGGKKCMNIIDIDRCLRAKEYNYDVYLSTLDPPSCTPKNNLLVGIPK